jgi:hypothetical protein
MLEPTLYEGTRTRQAEKYCHRACPLEAPGESYHASYSAVGKAHDTGQDVTAGRSPHRQLLPDTVGPEDQEPTSLRGIANKAVCLTARLCTAEASTTEEPDAGKLHVRDGTGGAG